MQLSAAYRRHNQNFRVGWHFGRKPVGKADGFIAHKYVDVLADRALLIHDPVSQAGIFLPQRCERFRDGCR